MIGRMAAPAGAPVQRLAGVNVMLAFTSPNSGFAIVATGERRLYGNIILKKGVIRPD